jgi:predicted RNA-binding protein with PUA-like domain
MKSEPDVYSIDDLKRDKKTGWDGIRNYQARNMMRDDMEKGDLVLFYHSNAKPPGVAGVAEVSKTGHPDPTQFDEKNKYFDAKSDPEDPRWIQVELKYKKTLKRYLPLPELRETKGLEKMALLQKGQRLSIQPVAKREFDLILKLADS